MSIRPGAVANDLPTYEIRMFAAMPPLLILCHHPESKAGPLMVSLRALLADGQYISALKRADVQYQDLTETGAYSRIREWLDRYPDGWVLFTGALSLATRAALRTLLATRGTRRVQMVFWHDTSTILRVLIGWEDGGWISRGLRRMRFALIKKLLDNHRTYHLAVSKQCKQLVMFCLGVTYERVQVTGESIVIADYPVRDWAARHAEVRFCGAGDLGWRKGVDLFVGLAGSLRAWGGRPARFTWFGGNQTALDAIEGTPMGRQAVAYGVAFPGHQHPLADALAQQDIFLMTSRDDPFPLVALEALACDLPVFCFDVTGTAEIMPDAFVCGDFDDMVAKVRAYETACRDYPPGYFRDIARKYGHDGRIRTVWREWVTPRVTPPPMPLPGNSPGIASPNRDREMAEERNDTK